MLNDRVREARTQLGLTQTEFGARFGVSIDVIKNIEYARSTPSELLLNHMCEIHHINRTWLETGEGEMFTQRHKDEKILASVNASPALQSMLAIWEQLSDENKAVFERFAADFADDYQRRKSEAAINKNQEIVDRGESDLPDSDQKQA